MSEQIEKLYDKIKDSINTTTIITDVQKAVYDIYSKFVTEDGRYCTKFKIPTTSIVKIIHDIGLDINDVRNAFMVDWGLPRSDHKMYGNEFYHILLLLYLYAVRHHQDKLAKNTLALILFRMWNGRLSNAIKFCDSDTMDYVTMYIGTSKHLWKKYKTPASLILEYFVPTLNTKYKSYVLSDSNKLKLLFNQCYSRLFQIFYQNITPSLTNPGTTRATSGLAVYYYDAKQKGLKMSKSGSIHNNEEEPEFETKFNSSSIEELVNTITNSIVMNYRYKEDPNIIQDITHTQHVNNNTAKILYKEIHNNKYSEYLYDIIGMIIEHIKYETGDICNKKYYKELIKKRIISSKHTKHNITLKKYIDAMLSRIFENNFENNYHDYSDVRKTQIRNSVIIIVSDLTYQHLCK